jgi:hypothetical protein
VKNVYKVFSCFKPPATQEPGITRERPESAGNATPRVPVDQSQRQNSHRDPPATHSNDAQHEQLAGSPVGIRDPLILDPLFSFLNEQARNCFLTQQARKDLASANIEIREHFRSKQTRASINPSDIVNTPHGTLTQQLRHYQNLTELTIVGDIGDMDLSTLHADCPKLKRLNLSMTGLEDRHLVELHKLAALQRLDLSFNEITDEGVGHLKGLRSLQRLDLSMCNDVSDAGIEDLIELTSLKNLNLAGLDITDKSILRLEALPDLKELNLMLCRAITDAGIEQLKALPSLKHLTLGGDRITDASIAHLKAVPDLQRLDLNNAPALTDAGLTHLTALSSLQRLRVHDCERIADRDVSMTASAR